MGEYNLVVQASGAWFAKLFARYSSVLLIVALSVALLYSQAAVAPDSTNPTFKSKVQVVLVDVVVTDHNGQPIKGLPSDSFEVLENGKRQTIASFEEHRGEAPPPVVEPTVLPPHVYSNAPLGKSPGAINILLLDALNTPVEEQGDVRRQMINYLKTMEPGPYLAIFALGSRLQMVTGFSDDPNTLLYAINHKGWGGSPQAPMMRTPQEDSAEQAVLNNMASSPMGGQFGAGSIAPPAMIEAFANFLGEMKQTERGTSVWQTLGALQELCRYLSGFRGRKNIIWFSGSFPQIDFPAGGERTRVDDANGAEKAMRDTINMLAAAQVAVYPVAAEGLEPPALNQAQSLAPVGSGSELGEQMVNGQNEALQQERQARYFDEKAADDIASNTGGQAFYNTNGLKEAIAEVVHKGAYYYRISYYPTDKKMVGRYRRVQVKVKKGPYATPSGVFFRHGYFEEDERHEKKDATPPDYLQPLMGPTLPNSTEILYNLRVLRLGPKPAGSDEMGDSRDLRGPTTRFSADFIIPVDSLDFDITPDGVRHGAVELALVAYDHSGKPLNWVFRYFKTSLKPEMYPAVKTIGVRFHQEIDVPDGQNYLRAGVYDVQAEKSGTMELPLDKVTGPEKTPEKVAATNPQELLASPPQPAAVLGPGSSNSPSQPEPAKASPEAENATFKLVPQDDVLNIAGWRAYSSASSPEQLKEALPSDVPQYCASLAGTGEHAAALEKVCEFAFTTHATLPDVICDRETKRYRDSANHAEKMLDNIARGKPAGKNYFDVVSAKVAYLHGREYYEKVRINGVPADASAPWRGGTWSIGEFSSILVSMFLPSSKPEFHFDKEELVHSVPALVFDFHVLANNNKSYFLSSGDRIWFPEYSGKLWLDKNTFRLLRLQRQTPYMAGYPIRRARTEIDYADVALGDGTNLVLPTASTALVCSQSPGYCGVNAIAFAGWQKFRATTNIVLHPTD